MTSTFRTATLVLCIVLLASSCGTSSPGNDTSTPDDGPNATVSSSPASTESAQGGGTVRIAMASLPEVLDPNTYISPPGSFPKHLFHRGLTKMDEDDGQFVPVPDLAADWEAVDDTTWQFNLAEGLEFPNGQPLDAHAVAETFTFVLDPENNEGWASQINTISAVEAMNPTTVLFETAEPDPILPSRVSGIGIVASEELEAIAAEEISADMVVSVGPWIATEFVPQERLVLEPNPDSQVDVPAIDRLEFIEIPEGGARIAALQAGEVDVVHRVPTDLASTLDGNGSRLAYTIETGTYTPTFNDVDSPPFDDVRVRQAFNYAIDKEGLISVLGGYGAVADGQLANPGYSGYCEGIEAYPYDPDKARSLLTEAGYEAGLSIGITGSSGFFTDDRALVEALAAMLENVGVSVELDIREPGRFLDAFYDANQRLDIVPWRGTLLPSFDVSQPMAYFESSHEVGISNYQSPEYDSIFAEARKELDPEKRQSLLCEAAEILHQDLPMIFTIHFPDIYAVADRLERFDVRQDQVPVFESIQVGQE